MWARKYKDYPPDSANKHEQVEPGQGIIGCEMHEQFGWGNTLHVPAKKKRSLFSWLFLKEKK